MRWMRLIEPLIDRIELAQFSISLSISIPGLSLDDVHARPTFAAVQLLDGAIDRSPAYIIGLHAALSWARDLWRYPRAVVTDSALSAAATFATLLARLASGFAFSFLALT